jgi:hypothetical protein
MGGRTGSLPGSMREPPAGGAKSALRSHRVGKIYVLDLIAHAEKKIYQ